MGFENENAVVASCCISNLRDAPVKSTRHRKSKLWSSSYRVLLQWPAWHCMSGFVLMCFNSMFLYLLVGSGGTSPSAGSTSSASGRVNGGAAGASQPAAAAGAPSGPQPAAATNGRASPGSGAPYKSASSSERARPGASTSNQATAGGMGASASGGGNNENVPQPQGGGGGYAPAANKPPALSVPTDRSKNSTSSSGSGRVGGGTTSSSGGNSSSTRAGSVSKVSEATPHLKGALHAHLHAHAPRQQQYGANGHSNSAAAPQPVSSSSSNAAATTSTANRVLGGTAPSAGTTSTHAASHAHHVATVDPHTAHQSNGGLTRHTIPDSNSNRPGGYKPPSPSPSPPYMTRQAAVQDRVSRDAALSSEQQAPIQLDPQNPEHVRKWTALKERMAALDIEAPQRMPSRLPHQHRCICPKCDGGSGAEESLSINILPDFSALTHCHRRVCRSLLLPLNGGSSSNLSTTERSWHPCTWPGDKLLPAARLNCSQITAS